jgi:hypothetical protein
MVDPIGAILERGNAHDREELINAARTCVMVDPTPITSSQQRSQNSTA